MSRALSVYHGRFGRATLYELNRPMTTHAHREGHLIFYLDGATATAPVSGELHGLTERCAIAVNPWEPHGFIPGDFGAGGLFLVLYIDRSWFQRMGHVGAHCAARVRALRNRDDAAHPRDRERDRVAARRLRHRGELRRHAVRADRRLFRAILAAGRRLAALFAARHRPSSTSGCANRSS